MSISLLIVFLVWLGTVVAVEALTELISTSAIMFPIRDWFARPAPEDPKRGRFKRFLHWLRGFIGELLNCGYCTSVWVAGLAAYCTGFTSVWTFIVKVLVIHRISNLLHELFNRWFNRLPFSFVLTHIHNKGDDSGPKES